MARRSLAEMLADIDRSAKTEIRIVLAGHAAQGRRWVGWREIGERVGCSWLRALDQMVADGEVIERRRLFAMPKYRLASEGGEDQ
jgi:hypothetical protein